MRHVIDFFRHFHAPERTGRYSAFLLLAYAGAHPMNGAAAD